MNFLQAFFSAVTRSALFPSNTKGILLIEDYCFLYCAFGRSSESYFLAIYFKELINVLQALI